MASTERCKIMVESVSIQFLSPPSFFFVAFYFVCLLSIEFGVACGLVVVCLGQKLYFSYGSYGRDIEAYKRLLMTVLFLSLFIAKFY